MPVLIPLAIGSKSPRRGGSWKGTESDDPAVHEEWLREGFNLGFLPENNGAVVVDIDNKDKAREWYRIHKNVLGPLAETRNGIHVFFAGIARTRKLYMDGAKCGDIKGNGYTVFPPSKVKGWQYRFVQEWGPLPPFPAELFPEPVAPELVSQAGAIRDAVKYISHIHAVSGQGGHNATFRAVCKLRDAGFSEAEALAAMLEWNETNAEPKWTVGQLLHKTKSAFSRTLKGA